jgi:hypothetical protein
MALALALALFRTLPAVACLKGFSPRAITTVYVHPLELLLRMLVAAIRIPLVHVMSDVIVPRR